MRRTLPTLAIILAASPLLADESSGTESPPTKMKWLDSSHDYVVHHADNIAEWFDGFFGDARTEEEAPYSTLRLRIEGDWDENIDFDSDVKLRGKVHLPQLNKRLSLLFSDDEDTARDDLNVDSQDTPDDVALQYRAKEEKNYRVDFKVGIRSSGDPKASVRYRYQKPLSENITGRFSEEIFYRGGEGAGSRTRLEFDKTLSENKVLSWNNRLDWDEDESGVEWSSSVALNKRLSDKKALSYYVSGSGETQPDGLTNSYGVGVRYRQNFLKPWLYFEVQPNYRWIRDDRESSRDGTAGVFFRLEAVFERAVK